MCAKTTGNCPGGCKDGHYGVKCDLECGNCKSGTCNTQTGECSTGCEAGYQGDKCDQGYIFIIYYWITPKCRAFAFDDFLGVL